MAAIDGLAMVIGLDIFMTKRCERCDEFINPEDYEIGPLYQCPNCEQTFTRKTSAGGSGNRCPQCNRFGTKIEEEGCPDCGEGYLEDVYAVVCPWCDKIIDVEEFDEHITCGG